MSKIISADFLYTYNEIVDMSEFFMQMIIKNNTSTKDIQYAIETFDIEEYKEFFKEDEPLEYLEYLKEFGTLEEYNDYKEEIKDKLKEEKG